MQEICTTHIGWYNEVSAASHFRSFRRNRCPAQHFIAFALVISPGR
jgi:hypothetical protein